MTNTIKFLTIFRSCRPALLLLGLFICGWTVAPARAESLLWAGKFSDCRPGKDFPEGWEALTFDKIDRHTRYELVKDQDEVVVMAVSEDSSSGMIRKMTVDPSQYPIVSWRWKVGNVYTKGDATRKEGDDYPARIYVTFAYDPQKIGFAEKLKYQAARLIYGAYPPTGALTYIWASRTPVGTILPNPYTDRVRMIVIESGDGNANRWVQEERNLYQDYQAAFGSDPPPISGIAIMTDSDNTREAATAYYGDIVFKSP